VKRHLAVSIWANQFDRRRYYQKRYSDKIRQFPLTKFVQESVTIGQIADGAFKVM